MKNKIVRKMPAGLFGGYVEVYGTEDEWRAFDARRRRGDLAVGLIIIVGAVAILAISFS